jgi:protein TonB
MNLQISKKPINKPLEIDIVLERIIQTPPPVEQLPEILPVEPIEFDPIPEPKPIIKPKPVEKLPEQLPEILPVEPIKFDPIPEPMVQEIIESQPDISNIIPIQKNRAVPEKIIDVRAQQKIIESYGALLTKHISAFKKYPRIAQRRVWEGDILLEITLNKNSNILNIKVINESKYEVLNKEAVAMIERAQPLPKANNIKSETFKVFVPVAFKLR